MARTDDRTAAIRALGAELRAATAASDWNRLDSCVHALGAQLALLAGHGAWNATERGALAELRAAHADAAHACARAGDELGARLEQMRNNKDGWAAYALESANIA